MRAWLITIFLSISLLSMAQGNCTSNRYKQRVFNNIIVQRDVQYGSAPDYTGLNRNLKFDLFMPGGDTLQRRPVIIFAHAGAFIDVINDKGVNDMQAFADSFAHKGYVTLSIDYRCGYIGLQSQVERAVYRAGQDAKAVVRFLRANHQLYGIDTTNIFFAGSSAGGVLALAMGYIDQESERPASSYGGGILGPDLGCLDCAVNSYTNTSNVKAVVSLWGGLDDTTYLQSASDVPALLVHGRDDEIVPFGKGKPFSNIGLWFPDMYGSEPMAQRMSNLGIQHEFYPFQLPPLTINHEFYGSTNGYWLNPAGPVTIYWDTIHTLVTNFLYKQLEPQIDTLYGRRNVCIGSQQLYVLPHTDGSKYCIDVTRGHVSLNNGDSISITWDSTGIGEINIKELSELDAESDAYTLAVIVNALPVLAPPADQTTCAGTSVTLQATGSGNVSWSPSAGLSSTTGVSTIANPPSTTTYHIVLTDANGCVNNDSVQVVVNPLPVADFNLTVSGLQVQLSDSNSSTVSWSWDFGDGNTSTDPSPAHVYTQSGNYTITLSITDTNGCTGTDTKSLYVSGPNGIYDENGNDITIIPQYTLQTLYIRSSIKDKVHIAISDLSGRVVYQSVNANPPHSLNLSKLNPGIYIISIRSQGCTLHRKFLWQ